MDNNTTRYKMLSRWHRKVRLVANEIHSRWNINMAQCVQEAEHQLEWEKDWIESHFKAPEVEPESDPEGEDINNENVSDFYCTIDMEHTEVHIFKDGVKIGKVLCGKDNHDPFITIYAELIGPLVILTFDEINIIMDNWNAMEEIKNLRKNPLA